ncbi:uncharacterized protein TrAFT101_009570 [Trichoderma asperellum]|uniref:uncharacterized protein n=1 Tax=Trichoderma asperellum TaxID=101201 RepID=UPI00331B7A03|nr:hypothetical protein TrAFT101_009570 [Trichoderma asperellum]
MKSSSPMSTATSSTRSTPPPPTESSRSAQRAPRRAQSQTTAPSTPGPTRRSWSRRSAPPTSSPAPSAPTSSSSSPPSSQRASTAAQTAPTSRLPCMSLPARTPLEPPTPSPATSRTPGTPTRLASTRTTSVPAMPTRPLIASSRPRTPTPASTSRSRSSSSGLSTRPLRGRRHPLHRGHQLGQQPGPFIERKLYTVNTGHATAAYHGYNRRKRTVFDALQDKQIMAEVRGALTETKNLLVAKHGIDEDAQEAYMNKIIKRIGNPHLEDAVERVGRAPLRKLSRKERFVGPAAEAAENDMPIHFLLDAIEMTFRFQDVEGDDESKELSAIMSENTPEDVVAKVCGIQATEKIYPRLVEVVKRVQDDSRED